jgi:hypothetical protein
VLKKNKIRRSVFKKNCYNHGVSRLFSKRRKTMKKFFSSAVLILAVFALAAFADIRVPDKQPTPQPTATTARDVSAADASFFSLPAQTVVGGLLLALAIAGGGVWLARRGGGKVWKTAS